MKKTSILALALAMAATVGFVTLAHADRDRRDDDRGQGKPDNTVQLGPRPFYLVEGLDDGKLKDRLMQCQKGPFHRTDFSIAHRGAALQFPEHSDVSYRAGARMGAGIVECDVTFTKDGELVCRHSECDLHTTTNIVATDLNSRCTVPWRGAGQDPKPKCCTSDLTLTEYKSLEAKMDASNPSATTPEAYLGGTAAWRTDLYTGRAQVLTFKESIELNRQLGVKHTPELKGPSTRIASMPSSAARRVTLKNSLTNSRVRASSPRTSGFSPLTRTTYFTGSRTSLPLASKPSIWTASIRPPIRPSRASLSTN